MLLLLFAAACDPIVIGLEEADTTAPMTWTSRVPECVDGQIEVEIGPRWQFLQLWTYDDRFDRWSPIQDGIEVENGTVRTMCSTYPIRVSWVSLPE